MKQFTSFIVLLLMSLISSCSDEYVDIGIMGKILDESGNALPDVSVSYIKSEISTQTNSAGKFSIDQPRTLFLEFKKDGYHTLSTKITNFSGEVTYDFDTITLIKSSKSAANYQDISKTTDYTPKTVILSGRILNIFSEPIENASVILKDSLKSKVNNDENKTNFELGDF